MRFSTRRGGIEILDQGKKGGESSISCSLRFPRKWKSQFEDGERYCWTVPCGKEERLNRRGKGVERGWDSTQGSSHNRIYCRT